MIRRGRERESRRLSGRERENERVSGRECEAERASGHARERERDSGRRRGRDGSEESPGTQPAEHANDEAVPGAQPADGQPHSEGPALANFTLLYESRDGRYCLFEDADGHLTSVNAARLI